MSENEILLTGQKVRMAIHRAFTGVLLTACYTDYRSKKNNNLLVFYILSKVVLTACYEQANS